MDPQNIILLITAVVGSNAIFQFIQFMIKRRDDRNDKLRDIQEEFRRGLNEREETGRKRYEEHKESIEKLSQAVLQLTDNNVKLTEFLHNVGEGVKSLEIDKLIFLTNKISQRGSITADERATVDELYEACLKLGGKNAHVKAGYDSCNNLPFISRDDAEIMDARIRKKEENLSTS